MKTMKENCIVFLLVTLAANFLLSVSYAAGADITEPVPGSVLVSTTETFTWNDTGASEYWLWIGISEGGYDVYSGSQGTGTSVTVNDLPCGSETLFVRLFSKSDTQWVQADFIYTACNLKAVIQSPAPGSVLSSDIETFTWNNTGVSGYWLWIGTSEGDYDVYSGDQGTNISKTVAGLPYKGETLYVRLFSKAGGGWGNYTDSVYTACNMTAAIQSPAPGSVLSSESETFTWNNAGAFGYWLWIGTSEGDYDVYSGDQGANVSKTVAGLPYKGETLYVRLFSKAGGGWDNYTDSVYTACDMAAVIQSPVPGPLPNSAQTFAWNSSGASQYRLLVGTSQGGHDIYFGEQTTGTSVTVSGLPVSGEVLYVRLLSLANSEWLHNDYIYNENLPVPTVSITADTDITETGGSVTLTWNSSDAESVSVSHGIGTFGSEGSKTVSPQSTITYTATAAGPGGTASASVRVWVTDPELMCSESSGDFSISFDGPPNGAVIPLSEGPCFAVTGSFDAADGFSPEGASANCTSCLTDSRLDLKGNNFFGEICPIEAGSSVASVEIYMVKKECAGYSCNYEYESASAGTCMKYGLEGVPDIVVNNPREGSITYSSSGFAGGIVNDPGADVEVNGIPADVYDNGWFEADGLALDPGRNIITAVCRTGDQTASHSVSVIYEVPLPPVVTVTDPADGATADKAFITVSGTAESNNPAPIQVYVGGIRASLEGNIFTAEYVPLIPGLNTVTVTAENYCGSGTGTVTVIYEPVMPVPFEQKLLPSDETDKECFGKTVAVSGDYAIVSAACYKLSNPPGMGYIFKRDVSGRWYEQAKLIPGDGPTGGIYGVSVAIDGEYAVIGVRTADNETGAAYVFRRDASGIWNEQKKLTASDGAEDDHFGNAVAADGNYVIVGAVSDDGAGSHSGSAYIFRREGSDWIEEARLTPSYQWWNTRYGYDVGISGDYAFVSARNINSAYIYRRDGSGWTSVKYLSETYSFNDAFAHSLDIDGNYAIAGTDDADRAYIFGRNSSGYWSDKTELSLPAGSQYTHFGVSVSVSGEYAVVGADGSYSSPGAAYIYKHGAGTWEQESELTPGDTTEGDKFGRSVAVNGGNVIVGADGAAYIYPILTAGISADPETVAQGQSCTLTWTSTHADSCVIEPGIGSTDKFGSVTVSPAETTTYVM
ncbi:MAG: hypothetical protein GY762_19385, partial [Proteobacteria bacterium]|nr:hypothetical protein [Pseudomonadota bacterium]